MASISVDSVCVKSHRIEVLFEVSDDLRKYFSPMESVFWLEYSEDISKVTPSIAVIPFVCNVLPIVWLTDAKLIIPEIDQTFFNSIIEFKQGYIDMYPMLEFKGKVEATKVVMNTYCCNGGKAAFFSGGVDSFSTLIAHRRDFPILITLRGADIKLDDVEGWNNVYNHTLKTVRQFHLPSPVFITSNFRSFINSSVLSRMVKSSGDDWWHGFQHGIGIISQAAPVAYLKQFEIIYIASSQTSKRRTTIASYPSIDNYVRFGSTSIWHDQFELTRTRKLQLIVSYCKGSDQSVDLRVCWVSRGGGNCCHCEKCYRTMFGLMAEGEYPDNYGMDYNNDDLIRSHKLVRNYMLPTNGANNYNKYLWSSIVSRFRETGAFKNDQRINWIYKFNPYAKPHKLTAIERGFKKLKRVVKKFVKG